MSEEELSPIEPEVFETEVVEERDEHGVVIRVLGRRLDSRLSDPRVQHQDDPRRHTPE